MNCQAHMPALSLAPSLSQALSIESSCYSAFSRSRDLSPGSLPFCCNYGWHWHVHMPHLQNRKGRAESASWLVFIALRRYGPSGTLNSAF